MRERRIDRRGRSGRLDRSGRNRRDCAAPRGEVGPTRQSLITALSQQQLTTANVQNLVDIQKPHRRFGSIISRPSSSRQSAESAPVPPLRAAARTSVSTSTASSTQPDRGRLQLPNVTSVQVLKGPQGTLFGHNTTGGAILVTTADPTVDPRAEANVSYARFMESIRPMMGASELWPWMLREHTPRAITFSLGTRPRCEQKQLCRRLRKLDGPHRPQVPVLGRGIGARVTRIPSKNYLRPRAD